MGFPAGSPHRCPPAPAAEGGFLVGSAPPHASLARSVPEGDCQVASGGSPSGVQGETSSRSSTRRTASVGRS